MKRITALLLSLALALLLLAGCGRACNSENAAIPGETASSGETGSAPGEGNGPIVLPVEPDYPASAGGEVAEPEDTTRMVMVDGVLYADTGRLSQAEGRCGVMDGYLTSSVDSGVPTRDDQSNFGTGYGYQLGFEEDTIEVCIGQDWVVFAPAE